MGTFWAGISNQPSLSSSSAHSLVCRSLSLNLEGFASASRPSSLPLPRHFSVIGGMETILCAGEVLSAPVTRACLEEWADRTGKPSPTPYDAFRYATLSMRIGDQHKRAVKGMAAMGCGPFPSIGSMLAFYSKGPNGRRGSGFSPEVVDRFTAMLLSHKEEAEPPAGALPSSALGGSGGRWRLRGFLNHAPLVLWSRARRPQAPLQRLWQG